MSEEFMSYRKYIIIFRINITRSDKIQALITVSQDKVRDIVDKNRAMDQRNKRYQELRERCLQQKEHQERLKESERKKYLKNF